MGREDLIGNGKRHLVPSWQPEGTGKKPEGVRKHYAKNKLTKHTVKKKVTKQATNKKNKNS